ncbi:hypothetical protein QVD99_005928 [Batrachochytrium dendrobatidis]|nr:hypothetical protein QVD99_005928 [Batrachochytrium dendrobatidis]
MGCHSSHLRNVSVYPDKYTYKHNKYASILPTSRLLDQNTIQFKDPLKTLLSTTQLPSKDKALDVNREMLFVSHPAKNKHESAERIFVDLSEAYHFNQATGSISEISPRLSRSQRLCVIGGLPRSESNHSILSIKCKPATQSENQSSQPTNAPSTTHDPTPTHQVVITTSKTSDESVHMASVAQTQSLHDQKKSDSLTMLNPFILSDSFLNTSVASKDTWSMSMAIPDQVVDMHHLNPSEPESKLNLLTASEKTDDAQNRNMQYPANKSNRVNSLLQEKGLTWALSSGICMLPLEFKDKYQLTALDSFDSHQIVSLSHSSRLVDMSTLISEKGGQIQREVTVASNHSGSKIKSAHTSVRTFQVNSADSGSADSSQYQNSQPHNSNMVNITKTAKYGSLFGSRLARSSSELESESIPVGPVQLQPVIHPAIKSTSASNSPVVSFETKLAIIHGAKSCPKRFGVVVPMTANQGFANGTTSQDPLQSLEHQLRSTAPSTEKTSNTTHTLFQPVESVPPTLSLNTAHSHPTLNTLLVKRIVSSRELVVVNGNESTSPQKQTLTSSVSQSKPYSTYTKAHADADDGVQCMDEFAGVKSYQAISDALSLLPVNPPQDEEDEETPIQYTMKRLASRPRADVLVDFEQTSRSIDSSNHIDLPHHDSILHSNRKSDGSKHVMHDNSIEQIEIVDYLKCS